jgi:sugar lactone lactonase YvrE
MRTLALLAVVLLGGPSGKATLSFPDVGVVAGAQSTARVSTKQARVVFSNGASRVSVRARQSTLRFALPRAGAWRYRILVGRRVVGTGSVRARAASLPGARPHAVCAAAGAFWPAMTLAVDFDSLWIACKSQSRILRLDPASGAVRARIRLPRAVEITAVATGLGSVWALDARQGTLYRIDPSRNAVVRSVLLATTRGYNIWTGAGSVWVVDDGSGELMRVDPNGAVIDRIAVGDGPSDLVFAGEILWVVNHRDRGLVRVDTTTRAVTRLATLPGETPERLVRAGGSLWITGRGTDLMRVDETTGAVLQTIDVDASGIDLVAVGDAVWIPTRSAAVDPSGLPTMARLLRVRAGAADAVATAAGRVDVNGLVADGSAVWLADNTNGVLYRVPAG